MNRRQSAAHSADFEGGWTARQDVAELIAPMPAGLERYRPFLRYFLLDEGRVPGEELDKAEGLCAILIRLEWAGSLEEAAAILLELKERLKHPRYTTLRRGLHHLDSPGSVAANGTRRGYP